MKKLVITLVLSCLFAVNSMAQEKIDLVKALLNITRDKQTVYDFVKFCKLASYEKSFEYFLNNLYI